MMVHIHRLLGDDRPECLVAQELEGATHASIEFAPEDVTEPWTFILHEPAAGTVVLTMATSEQVTRLKLGVQGEPDSSALMLGLHGERVTEEGGEPS